MHGVRTRLQPEATGSERCLPSEYKAQRRRDQRDRRESEESARCAAGHVREEPHHVWSDEAAHVTQQRTHQCNARSRRGPPQKRCGQAPKRCPDPDLGALSLCLVLGPFLVFAPQLAVAKRRGPREYGTLAERYVREFDSKWMRGQAATANEPLVGSADIQSLADLDNSFEIVKTMRVAPITRDALVGLVVATLAPVVPLALTMMSLEELLKTLFGILF
jgi:hypothetical protein